MDIAVKRGMVRREQEGEGLHRTYYVANPEYASALKKVLPEALK
jgi:hypothetical protein